MNCVHGSKMRCRSTTAGTESFPLQSFHCLSMNTRRTLNMNCLKTKFNSDSYFLNSHSLGHVRPLIVFTNPRRCRPFACSPSPRGTSFPHNLPYFIFVHFSSQSHYDIFSLPSFPDLSLHRSPPLTTNPWPFATLSTSNDSNSKGIRKFKAIFKDAKPTRSQRTKQNPSRDWWKAWDHLSKPRRVV